MKLNRTWAMVVAIVMALTLSLGSTLAYLSDTDSDVNVMVLGNVQIEQHEQERVGDTDDLTTFTNGQTIYPGVYLEETKTKATGKLTINGHEVAVREKDKVKNYVDKIVTVENTGKSDAYVRTIFAFPEAGDFDTTYNASEQWLHWNGVSDGDNTATPSNGWVWGTEEYYNGKKNDSITDGLDYSWPANYNGWYVVENVTIAGKVYDLYVATNINKIAPKAKTAPNLLGFYLDCRVDNDIDEAGNVTYTWTAKDGTVYNLGDISQIEILVATQAVQADGFADAWTALEEGFGNVSEDSHPWLDMNGIEEGDQDPDDVVIPTVVSSNDELTAALDAGATNIHLQAGNYTLPTSLANVSLTANGDANIEVTAEAEAQAQGIALGDNVTLSGINFTNNQNNKGAENAAYVGVKSANVTIENCTFTLTDTNSSAIGIGGGANNVTIKNCVFTGGFKHIGPLSGTPGDVTIDGCTFGGTNSSYGMHLNVTANDLTVKNSTVALFNTYYGAGNDAGKLTFENCDFVVVSGKTNVVKLYRDADFVNCYFEDGFWLSDANKATALTFESCTAEGYDSMKERMLGDSFSNDMTVVVDGETIVWDASEKKWTEQ